jgi:hypothetical protein
MSYAAYFLNSQASIVQLELLEISHPNFEQVFYLCRNACAGITVTLEDTSVQTFAYCPMKVSQQSCRDNLDFSLRIDIGDLGEFIPVQIDAIAAAGTFGIKPLVKYRTYRSDDLSTPLFGPITLEITTFSFTKDGASFEAKAPSLNINKTGEIYKLDRFPMLRGFL